MKKIIISTLLLVFKISLTQNNIIPNSSFEIGSATPNCDYSGDTPNNLFNNSIDNWKVAKHNNDKGRGTPDWQSISACAGQYYCPTGYGIFPSESNRFIAIKADIKRCFSGGSFNNYHEAVCVSLPSGGNFINGKDYTIRYKVIPVVASIEEGTPRTSCVDNISFCHLRFFLSEKGYLAWNHSSSTKQEITNANYQSLPDQYCDWQIVERNFTCNYGNLTTLVLYAEQGGFLIDDVEIFEKCNGYYLIQNKKYFSEWYPASLNFGEKSGSELYAGKNIDLSKPFADVTVMDQANVDYTATDLISLRDGFSAKNGSNFRAIITPCPNYYKLNNFQYTNSDDDNLISKEYKNSLTIIPNPNSGSFNITFEENTIGYLKVYNSLGILIYSEQISEPINKIEVNLQNTKPGIYNLVMETNSRIFNSKLIIQE